MLDLGNRLSGMYAGQAKNGRYALLVMDLFSKMVYARALKDKSGPSVLDAFKSIASSLESPYTLPNRVATDRGKEFTNEALRTFFKDHNVNFSYSRGWNKAKYAER